MPDMVNVRKAHAGTDSAGHTWPTDGAVIKVPIEHALVLAMIPDGGFAIIETPTPEAAPTSTGEVEAGADDSDDVKQAAIKAVASQTQRAGRGT